MSHQNFPNNRERPQRILGRVAANEFVGRAAELGRIVRCASSETEARGLLLLLEPLSGVSELLRQGYDALYNLRGEVLPFYFALSRKDLTVRETARRFLYDFLRQLIAFRRDEPRLCEAHLNNQDLLELAAPADYEWIERVLQSFEREEASGNVPALIRICLSAPQRVATQGARPFLLFNEVESKTSGNEVDFGAQLVQMLLTSPVKFVAAGLRRQLFDAVHSVNESLEKIDILRLEPLGNQEARLLTEQVASRQGVSLNDETRDLIVQQFSGSPFFITTLLQAARERNVSLTSFVNCQQLYVKELVGGRFHRYYTLLLDETGIPQAARRALLQLLYESAANDRGRSPVEAWRKKLSLDESAFNRVLRALHVYELANIDTNNIEVAQSPSTWNDYLKKSYRIEYAHEPRALVVASMTLESLRRAPQTMARHYRQAATLDLCSLLKSFNCQQVPASLLHPDRFDQAYKGKSAQEVSELLDAETDLIRLPQIVHLASAASFHRSRPLAGDDERCVVAHGFDGGNYVETSQVVWLALEIESKREAGRGVTELSYDRLSGFARTLGLPRMRFWLISNEGFSAEACELLNERGAYGSCGTQLKLLNARLNVVNEDFVIDEKKSNEFELVIPMGEDTELIAANTIEQIARRINFSPEAINQIKTALIEACINATEHSLSPDQKIYQRFRVESDKLMITIASRGIVPLSLDESQALLSESSDSASLDDNSKARRGWGLKLIRTLMDEVEFERVDDGTRLRMTKFLR
jgi:serine/threonine-protein kinase RsbW